MTAYPIEENKLAWITERLRDAMAEALFKQDLITEAQRRALCAAMAREPADCPIGSVRHAKNDLRRRPQ